MPGPPTTAASSPSTSCSASLWPCSAATCASPPASSQSAGGSPRCRSSTPPAQLQRRAIQRSLYGFTVGQHGAFWLERRRVRKVWEDRFEDRILLSVESDRGALFISPLPAL